MLKHDSNGFLLGEPIELATAIDIWEKIRDDIASIKGMISGQTVEAGNQSQAAAPSAQGDKGGKPDPQKISVTVVNKPGQVAANPSFSGEARSLGFGAIRPNREDQGVATPIRRVGRDNEVAPAANTSEAAAPSAQGAARDSSGRFVKKDSNEGGRDASGRFVKKGSGNDGAEGIASSFSEASAAKKVGQAVAEATRGTDDMDPTIKAFNEVLTPITGVAGALSGLGGNKDPERRSWFRRIFGELKSFRREETAYSKASARSLKGIERRPREGGGLMSMLASLLTRMPLIGGLMAGGGIMAGGGALGGLLGGAMKGGKGLLKRIPILGALLSSAGGLFDIFSSETDDNLTRGEKDKKTGKGAGGVAGTLGGMWAGAKMGAAVGALGGPIGAAIGGVVGGAAGMFFGEKAGVVIGETVGSWIADLREADIAGYFRDKWEAVTGGISAAWDSTTTFFTDKWESITASIGAAWDSSVNYISDTFTSVMTSIFGEKWAGIADSISQKWDSVTDAMGSKWDSITEGFSDKWNDVTEGVKGFFKRAGEGAKNALSGANEYVRETTGVDIKKNIDAAVDSTKKTTNEAIESIKKNANAVSDSVKGFFGFGSGGEAPIGGGGSSGGGGASASYSVSGWTIGDTSKRYESGKGGAGTVSTGSGDHGGASYGTYQLSSKMGTLDNFLRSSGYGAQFEGLRAGTADFNEKWKQVAESDLGFGDAQHNFIKETHFDPQMKKLKSAGIDLSSRGSAVLDAVWSTSTQFGGGTGLIQKALKDMDVAGMSDADIVSAIQDYKIKNNDSLFASSSAAVRDSTLNRAKDEKNTLLALVKNDPLRSSPVDAAPSSGLAASAGPVERRAVAVETTTDIAAHPSPALAMHMPAVTSPVMPAPQAVPPAPTTQSPLGSTGKKDQQTVTVEAPEAGQDVRDRSIAHIVTGGIST